MIGLHSGFGMYLVGAVINMQQLFIENPACAGYCFRYEALKPLSELLFLHNK